MPPGGLNIRPGRHALEKEELLHRWKRPAMLAFIRENRLDRIVMSGGRQPRLGIVSLGKSWLDTLGALDLLGIDEKRAADLGLRLYKVAAPWPLEPDGVNRFAEGLETILVVEEKRSLVETQVKEQLYGRAGAPMVVGKKDEENNVLLPAWGALDANQIAVIIARRILALRGRFGDRRAAEAARACAGGARRRPRMSACAFRISAPAARTTPRPSCRREAAPMPASAATTWRSGWTATPRASPRWAPRAPTGSARRRSPRATMSSRISATAPTAIPASLAIRAAAAAGVNITYKILFNDAVAMTGGQPVEGHLTVDKIARQVAAEGAKRIALVTDDPHKYPAGTELAGGHDHPPPLRARTRCRRSCATVKGLSVLIYDQTCAAEKRRRRKRGLAPDPDKRVIINTLVCEGCGDCGVKSNCVSIQPLETEFGRKRTIDQSSCNKDYSCLEGFCPSFVTVHGARLKAGTRDRDATRCPTIPEPDDRARRSARRASSITGVGGTGIVTVGAVLGMAAHLDGLGVGIIDMAGLAQKGGAVSIHMRIGPTPEAIHAIRIAAEEADTVLGCDIVVAGSRKALAAIRPGESRVFVNLHETYPGDFTRSADFSLPTRRLRHAIEERAGAGRAHFVEAERLATARSSATRSPPTC